jgi:hypothetical protein
MQMDNGIKTFKEFRSNPDISESGVYDYITGALSSITNPLSDVFKGKVTAYLLGNLGITENSIFSKLVQNFVEQIPISDYFSILFSGKTSAGYLAPKAADATMEFLTEMGLDGIAEKLGVDKNGWIYRTISEMFSNEVRRNNFRDQLEAFYLEAFNGFEPVDRENFIRGLSPTDKGSIERAIRTDIDRSGNKLELDRGNIVDDFIGGLISSAPANRNSFGYNPS